MEEWISVEDRSPGALEIVLGVTGSGNQYIVRGVGEEFWELNDNRLRKVTHWMPLPKRPKP